MNYLLTETLLSVTRGARSRRKGATATGVGVGVSTATSEGAAGRLSP